jgi:predicted nucleotidyltransferase
VAKGVRVAPSYPTPEHERLAGELTRSLSADPRVLAVLLSGSLARGRGVPESCLDLTVFVTPGEYLPQGLSSVGALEVVAGLDGAMVHFERVRADLTYTDGDLRPGGRLPREDDFELAVGNFAVYSTPLFDRGGHWAAWRQRFLPYVGEDIRLARLEAVSKDFAWNIDNIRQMARRGLLFHGLERVMIAFRYLIQLCFLSARVYPIDYMKHLEEQVTDLLGHPEWLSQMAAVFTLPNLTPGVLMAKADLLSHMADRFPAELR